MACISPFFSLVRGNWMPFPCGRCPPCKRRRIDGWVFRMLQESKRYADPGRFITLTYAPHSVPISPHGFMTLTKGYEDVPCDPSRFDSKRLCCWPRKYSYKKDLCCFTKYMKRLRKLCGEYPGPPLKYYAVGEYGSQTKRPHYHMILYNIEAPMFPIGKDDRGNMKYKCRVIEKCWPFGTVDIGGLSSDSAAYCAKYVSKPRRIPEHKRDDRVKEFSIMSKGLGDNYISDAILKYHQDDLSRNYLTLPGGYMKALPRYYRVRLYDDDQRLVQNRKIVKEVKVLDMKRRDDFARKYGEDFDFDSYDLEMKKGRLRAFWKNLKKRE